ncbi:MAG: 3-dehydro-scyllo-inosose hydrolase [Candidatus Hadarchaeum sp.]|uniref:3-dehydro-scyllo-inosose hydrolase n=1 Tax=Candidatus Hadarchaeum sp. TaxID=2883567 RepID=UPI0031777441
MSNVDLWITTEHPAIVFEDTEVGRLKKRIWEASEGEIDYILREFGIPSNPELGKPGSYIQNTVRARVVENRKKNDIVLIPVGCTENHGLHTISGLDTFMVTQICEAVRRRTEKEGRPVSLALPPLNYGSHPYHHIGMPGTVIVSENVVRETLINVMVGLWNDGFRKQIIVNNHGHLWVLESALHQFMYRYQLPGIFQVLDWHRAVREFFYPKGQPDSLETHFIHADEAETSIALLLFPKDMVDMSLTVRTESEQFLPGGHFDTSVDSLRRPHRWSEGEGHAAIELAATPEGVVGDPTKASAGKAKRAIAAILSYLVLVIDQILKAFPPGTVPPVEKVTLRTKEEMEPYLLEPGSPGWKPVYALVRRGF